MRATDLMCNTRIHPVKAPNKVQTVEKLESGALLVRQASGASFTIPAHETEMQTFVVWTMLEGS